ncbi:MAG: HAD-IG family 5'-nucleotidase, partial [Bdellovibrionaceae bacterium]|nr:HAD-IG family 5'-nucleotidase [Pseudobdellovibrionaceae bacterium]
MADVFVNRTLNLRKIKCVGFDMDHTLVRYNSYEFEKLAHALLLKKLVSEKGYPPEVLKFSFDFDSVIRGLIIDSQKGNLLKVSRHGAIRVSHHGTKRIDYRQQQKDYRGTYVDLSDSNFAAIDTAFSLSVAVLFGQLVDLKDSIVGQSSIPAYSQILADVINTMDMAHRDDSLKSIVRKDLAKYIIADPEIVHGLERYKKHGKTLFIVTNSDYHYSKSLLDFAINPFLKEHKSWQELFSYVVVSARKPRFFYDNQSFLKVNPADGTLTNYDADLVPGIYQGGCASLFEKSLGVDGEDILYVGDHIYGDIVRLKKDSKWRTALVIEELSSEIQSLKQANPLQLKIQELMNQKAPLERDIIKLASEEVETGADHDKEMKRLQDEAMKIDQQISHFIQQIQAIFNKYWGQTMRAGNEESYFAYQVDRFADIYMPSIADLMATSPRTYFRAIRRPLAHEISLAL